MANNDSEKKLATAAVWCAIFFIMAASYRYLVSPYKKDKLTKDTGSRSKYDHRASLALDSFAGYCILRSERFENLLAREGIKIDIHDDGADYKARLKALADGTVQMAIFTIDSLIAAGARAGSFPGTIILVIDESNGADAMVTKSPGIINIQALDRKETRIILTPGSPSEFLARVVTARFSLPSLPANWIEDVAGPGEVLARLKSTPAEVPRAFVLWEPELSRARTSGARVLIDSSRMRGYIVDVLVAGREFIKKNPEIVKKIVAAYLGANHYYSSRPDGLASLIEKDSSSQGQSLLDATAAREISKGILFRNTLENYAHFGLLDQTSSGGLIHLEDMIENITEVLLKTGCVDSDPLEGRRTTLFYDSILKELKNSGFHPGSFDTSGPETNDTPGDTSKGNGETIRSDATLPALDEAGWKALAPVGNLRIIPISFGRGGSAINISSKRILDALAKNLKTWPGYYLTLTGRTRDQGDPEANLKLALERAEGVRSFLLASGVNPDRLRVLTEADSGRGGDYQSVTFTVGQVPY